MSAAHNAMEDLEEPAKAHWDLLRSKVVMDINHVESREVSPRCLSITSRQGGLAVLGLEGWGREPTATGGLGFYPRAVPVPLAHGDERRW